MTHINQRRDTAANWTSANPVLQLGEVGWETNTRKAKLGDGSTAWNALSYIVEGEVTSVNGLQGVVVLDQDDIGLGNVDNTPDTSKPISTATQTALDLKAPLASPVLTGDPQAPTPTTGDDSVSVATTAFVRGEIDATTPPHMVVYSASGSFAKAGYPGVKAVRVRLVAGGGAGGGSQATSGGESSVGSGGSAGGYSESLIAATDLATSETVTIGAGGTGVSGAAGNDGGNSSFGSLVTANGGNGGGTMTAGSSGNVNPGVTAAAAGTGQIATIGGPGGGSLRVSGVQCKSGEGGDSRFAGGGKSAGDASSAGFAGSFGSGGSGAASLGAESAHTGGAGGAGRVIVELFY